MVGRAGQASPENALDWMGNPWNPKTAQGPAAHPNSRFTAPAENCPCISSEFNEPNGVPISAIIFGGRRAKTAPLVYQSRNWQHGVFVGSIMASEKTAAAEGKVGETRRDPMAMLPFCGYHMADYWQHWLDMEKDGPTRLRSSTSTGSAPMTTGSSSGPASARTCGCWSGFSSAASTRWTPGRPRSATCPRWRTSTWRVWT